MRMISTGPVSHHLCGTLKNPHTPGACFSKAPELFGPKKPIVKLQSTCFEKLIFEHVFSVRKAKKTAKFDGLESQHCEDIKRIMAPKICPKSFGSFEKQAPGVVVCHSPSRSRDTKSCELVYC